VRLAPHPAQAARRKFQVSERTPCDRGSRVTFTRRGISLFPGMSARLLVRATSHPATSAPFQVGHCPIGWFRHLTYATSCPRINLIPPKTSVFGTPHPSRKRPFSETASFSHTTTRSDWCIRKSTPRIWTCNCAKRAKRLTGVTRG
jgi:hypothetical protein